MASSSRAGPALPPARVKLALEFVFGLSPLPRTFAAATRDVRDPKLQVRISAIRDLCRHADGATRREALELLASALSEDTTAAVRAEAALALADTRACEHTDALVHAALHDGSGRVRQLSLVALGEVAPASHQPARQAIEHALESQAPELRFQAVIALHRLAGEEALPAVVTHTDDEDAQVRYVCWRILDEHWSEHAPPGDVLEHARDALSDASSEVRLAVALLLARLGDDSGGPVIASALNAFRRPTHPEDEHAAIELAGKRGLVQAGPGLERRAFGLFRSSGDAWHARCALARLGNDRARTAILRGLCAWSRDTRTAAVLAAGRAGLAEAREPIARMQGDDQRADPETVAEALSALSSEKAGA